MLWQALEDFVNSAADADEGDTTLDSSVGVEVEGGLLNDCNPLTAEVAESSSEQLAVNRSTHDVDESNDISRESDNAIDTTEDLNETNDESGYSHENGGGMFDMLFSNTTTGEELTPEMEAARRCELEETFTEPLLVDLQGAESSFEGGGGGDARSFGSVDANNGGGIAKENMVNENDNVDNKDNEEEEEDEVSIDIDEEEETAERKDMQQYLDAFHIEAHTDEISQLLSTRAQDDTITTTLTTPLQEHFQALVPRTVSYTDFWTRYYHRCNPTRIAAQWQRQEHYDTLRNLKQQQEFTERAMQEVSDAAFSIGRSAASFLKGGWSGAAGAATEVMRDVGGVVEDAATSLRVHQSVGRPPFVMSAVEDDGDEYYEESEEEGGSEEEEGGCGWNSDERDEEEEENVTVEEDEEVNFLEVSLDEEGRQSTPSRLPHTPLKMESLDVVRLRQSLMHTEESRNTMMQLVEERNEEMCKLRSVLERGERQCCPPSKNDAHIKRDTVDELEREAEWLKHLVAATTTNDSTRQSNSVNALKSILDQMRHDLDCQKAKRGGGSSTRESIKASEATIQDLQSNIQAMTDKSKSRDAELNEQARVQTQLDETKHKCNNLQNETEKTNRSIAQCKMQLQALQEKQMELEKEQAMQLEQALAQARSALVESPMVPTTPASTPDSSMSSGVKVSAETET